MTEPEYEDRQADLRREVRDTFGRGRDGSGTDPASERAYDHERSSFAQDGPLQERTQWTRPAADQNTNAARSRELSGDDWRLADLKYNEADQWRNEAEVADDRSEEAFVSAQQEPTAEGQESALDAAEHEADVAAASDHESRLSYDSAERRGNMAADLEARGVNRETADNRVRADVGQARPATEATRTTQQAAGRPTQAAGQQRTRSSRQPQAQRKGIRR